MIVRPKIIGFICNWSLPREFNTTNISKLEGHPKMHMIRLTCIGRIDPVIILDAFAKGADGVLLIGCHPPDCHFIEGNLQAERKIKTLKDLMSLTGLEPLRLHIDWAHRSETEHFVKIINDFRNQIIALGLSPLAKEKPNTNILLNMEAAKAAAENFRLRALIGKEKELVEGENVYGERTPPNEFFSLLHETIETEFLRCKIHLLTKERPLSVKKIAAITELKPASVLDHIVELRKKRMVILDHVDKNTPLYKALEVE